ncbi:MAG TPA: YsnF/AvaK domain-containing protein, partial [Thermomicrobiales bacterium]|nr:YsnF/AvaK domain-containing protein [Thermomicrobiales bacterium]
LTATKTPYERGEVRVEKDVVTEERVLDVPVTEEEVHVQRRAVDRPIEAPERAFEERVIEVPLRGEDVDVQKRVRVAEEVEISKEPVERTERVKGKVRREEVHVEETGVENPEIAGRTLRDEETETRM